MNGNGDNKLNSYYFLIIRSPLLSSFIIHSKKSHRGKVAKGRMVSGVTGVCACWELRVARCVLLYMLNAALKHITHGDAYYAQYIWCIFAYYVLRAVLCVTLRFAFRALRTIVCVRARTLLPYYSYYNNYNTL
jgi:hypothetical protein